MKMTYRAPRNYPVNKERVSLRELRKDYYKIRKFEIQNLWQRSIFLATFTVLLFTGYGFLVDKLISYSGTPTANNELPINLTHGVCSILAFLGCIFAIIWIMMSKGSKAWYEIYEKKIYNLEFEKLGLPKKFCMSGGSPHTLNNSILSCKPGAYSVSRINILLGQALLYLWFMVLNIHITILALALDSSTDRPLPQPSITIGIFARAFLITLSTLGFLAYSFKSLLESNSISRPEEDQEEKNNSLDHQTNPTSTDKPKDPVEEKSERIEEQKNEQRGTEKEENRENNEQKSRSSRLSKILDRLKACNKVVVCERKRDKKLEQQGRKVGGQIEGDKLNPSARTEPNHQSHNKKDKRRKHQQRKRKRK